MTCPHCKAEIKRRERSGNHCSKCRREFAFDPKGNALFLHDLRFRKKADRLALGGFKYSTGQLRTCLLPKGGMDWGIFFVVGLLIFMGLVALLAGSQMQGRSDPRGLVIFIGLVVLGAGLFVGIKSYLTFGRPMTDEVFRRDFVERWRKVYGAMPKGLIEEAELAALGQIQRPRENLAAVLVCPERELLNCLLANEIPRELRLGLLTTGAPADDWERGTLEALRRNPRLPILLLHDASATGVFLAQDLPALLGLDPHHRILDLGLNAKKSMSKKRFTVRDEVPPELQTRLSSAVIGADAAGARPLRRGRAQVTKEELDWLQSGANSPILALPPASLIKRIRLAMTKLKTYREPLPAEVAAQSALGFLSWPA